MSRLALDYVFAFGGADRRSTVWKVVVPRRKADIYLSNLDGQGEFKVSLHASGRCHISEVMSGQPAPEADPWGDRGMVLDELPAELARGESSGYGGYPSIWHPRELAPGLTMPFRVGISNSQLRQLPTSTLAGRGVHWVSVGPDADSFNEVAFFLSAASVSETADSWPGRRSMGTRLLVRHKLQDGRTLWMTSRWHPTDSEQLMWTHAYRPSVSPTRVTTAVDRGRYDISALIFTVDRAYGSFAIWETGP